MGTDGAAGRPPSVSQRPSANHRCIVRTLGAWAASSAWRRRSSRMTGAAASPRAHRASASWRSSGQAYDPGWGAGPGGRIRSW
jgi:hypothetical protein